MGRIVKILLIIILIAAVIAGGAVAFIKYYKPPDIKTMYQYASVDYEDVSKRVLTTGNMSPSDYAYVYINASETVSKVNVKVGDPVKTGDILITYDIDKDTSDLQRQLDSARLNRQNAQLTQDGIGLPAEGNELMQYTSDVTTAQHNLDQAQSDLNDLDNKIAQQQQKLDQAQRDVDRNKILLDSGDLSQADYDTYENTLTNAQLAMDGLTLSRQAGEDTLTTRQNQLDQANQRLVNAQDRMSDETNVIKYRQQDIAIQLIDQQIAQIQADMSVMTKQSHSPADGYVTAVNVREGEMANKGLVLIEIALTSQLIAKADVTEYDAPLLALGQKADITTTGLPDMVYNGVITKIASGAVEKQNSSNNEMVVPVEFTLNNEDSRLKDGYSVDIAVYIDRRNHVPAVPIQSVLLDGDEKYLYVLEGDELIKTSVTTGFYGDSSVEIVSGVSLGAKYAATPSEVKPLPDNWFTRSVNWLYTNLSRVIGYVTDQTPVLQDIINS